ncbi:MULTISPECIES: FemAB family XrtA/PEP-CTERM system-associated protein [unclassified Duganella]|uniref:FemAB family XrtA/PEP-CTERM system-associated protein n=1 Tax=unclassified Duganella TaxID=2636909 RepID=UPI000E353FF3|nr:MULTISPECIES: FemAB family XrtA/PEP-CTERM system-associated protein [unclassified Duganella]RFP19498.1 FemAB family PEP-CTERM system-associated protein [Duganella sp. BJB475]RFP36079.1 FemAB family PEP-CTERM system-associated protein [Duganella sp. BJB476]
MQWSVGQMGTQDHARWDAFVQRCPDATFFHRAGWQQVIETAFGHPTWYLYAESAGQIQAVLPLAQVNSRLFGNTLCSLPFCVYGGVAALEEGAAAAVDQAAQQLARRLRVDHLEYRQLQSIHADWLHKDLYATFRKPLAADPEKNLLAIPRKQRAMVRKGMAAGLNSVIDADTDRFYDNYATSVHRLGTPVFSRRYFRTLQQVFGDDCEILSVQHGDKAICSVLSFHFRDEILPYYGGGGDAARVHAGNDFMYWEVMRRATERGHRLFDFGRSKYGTGAFAFKKNWGFEPQPLRYDYQLHRGKQLKDVQPLNPRLQLLIRAWRILPLSLANAIGPHIVRQLG